MNRKFVFPLALATLALLVGFFLTLSGAGDAGSGISVSNDPKTSAETSSKIQADRSSKQSTDGRKTGKIPANLVGRVHIIPFDFDEMKAKDRELAILGLGAKQAAALETLVRDLQAKIIDSEAARFEPLDQDDTSVTVAVPPTSKMVELEENFRAGLKEIGGENSEILRVSIWPEIEVMTAEFGERPRVVKITALEDGKYKIQKVDFPQGTPMPTPEQLRKVGLDELAKGAMASWNRTVRELPPSLTHIFK